MLQTGLIQHAHDDLITDASYDFYGLRLATCSLDQRIKIWHLDESSGSWHVQDEWKAHEAPVSKVAWAHPEFGSVIASCSFDRTSKIWEQAPPSALLDPQLGVAGTGGQTQPVTRWIERNIMAEGKGTVRDVAFAPHYFGLKLATIASDNILRIYECIDQSSLTTWQLLQDIDVLNLPSSSTPTFYSRPHTLALGTPTQTFSSTSLGGGAGGLDKTSYADHAQALSQGLAQNAAINAANDRARHGVGNREADGGWCLSWCKDRYWGEILAASAGTSSVVKIVQLTPSRRHVTLLALDPSPSNNPASGGNPSGSATPAFTLPVPGNATHPSLSDSSSPDVPGTLGSSTTTAAGPANRPGSLSSHLNPAQTTITSQIQQQSQNPSSSNLNKSSITSLSWAPSCGRSYHLIATGSRDGTVRIWKVLPGEETDTGNGIGGGGDENALDVTGRDAESEDPRWTVASVVKVEHKSAVSRVEWNVTGTILSSAGNDGRVRLWKAGPDGEWKSAGSIGVEQAEESERGSQVDQRDVDME